jgi:hypothetical protein
MAPGGLIDIMDMRISKGHIIAMRFLVKGVGI